jgi:hypothetical protein
MRIVDGEEQIYMDALCLYLSQQAKAWAGQYGQEVSFSPAEFGIVKTIGFIDNLASEFGACPLASAGRLLEKLEDAGVRHSLVSFQNENETAEKILLEYVETEKALETSPLVKKLTVLLLETCIHGQALILRFKHAECEPAEVARLRKSIAEALELTQGVKAAAGYSMLPNRSGPHHLEVAEGGAA